MLNRKKWDRHRYDMIPQAFANLGSNGIPSPIEKPASATAARRQTIASMFDDDSPRRKSVSARRRKSVFIDVNHEVDSDVDFEPSGYEPGQNQDMANTTEVEASPSLKRPKIDGSSNSNGTKSSIEIGHAPVNVTSVPSIRVETDVQSHARARKTFPSPVSLPSNNSSVFSHRPIIEASSSQPLKDEPSNDSLDNLILHFSGSDEAVSPQSKSKQDEMQAAETADQIQSLRTELEKFRIENDILVNKNRQLTQRNDELVSDLIKANRELDAMTRRNAELVDVNKVLTESTEKFKSECKVENVKLVNEMKQKRWCAVCGLPCGRYYCSSECEKQSRLVDPRLFLVTYCARSHG